MRHVRRRACGSCQTCGRTERAHRSLQNRRRFRTAPTRLITIPSGRTKTQNLPESFSHRPTDSAEEADPETFGPDGQYTLGEAFEDVGEDGIPDTGDFGEDDERGLRVHHR